MFEKASFLFDTCTTIPGLISRPCHVKSLLIQIVCSNSEIDNMASNAHGCRRLENKVAIITGSTSGIGLAMARRMAQEGAAVMICSRKRANVESALAELRSEGLNVSGMVCHAANKIDRKRLIERTLKEFGGIDIMVANAAVNPHVGPMMDIDESKWDKIFDVNLKAVFFFCKEVYPYMKERGGGSIIMTSSAAAYKPAEYDKIGPYLVSKAAHFSLVKALSPQLARSNIRVNCIAPGVFKTKFGGVSWKDGAEKVTLQGVPMKRTGEVSECASAVAFLASDDASFITGETLTVAGSAIHL